MGVAIKAVVVSILITGVFVPRVLADDLIAIRCTGYEVPLPMSGGQRFYVPQDQQFDVFINLSKGIGWWSGGVVGVNESHPATLTTDPTKYRLEATLNSRGDVWHEWLTIDRITGEISQYAQPKGFQSEQLKRGGTCKKLEPKL